MFHIRIKVSTTHVLVYFFFHTYVSNSYIVFFKIELNAPLAISILFTISSSLFPFDVIVCPKYV